jgi:uncharacterized DUF497 family protein
VEELIVEWDEKKNVINKRIHHISFETAKLVFADPDRVERLDNSIGSSRDKSLRLISARLANKAERSSYYGNSNSKSSNWAKAN